MKKTLFALHTALAILIVGLSGCRPSGECSDCVVKGTVKGVRNGAKLELIDEWNHFNVVGTGRVRNGAFEIHPTTSGPAHVFLYVHNGYQLKDFFLEPGTITLEATTEDESLLSTGATGTPVNDLYHKYMDLVHNGQKDVAFALRDSVLSSDTGGSLALWFAHNNYSSPQALQALDKLGPDLAALPYVADLRDELTRRAKAEPRSSEDGPANLFVDMEYPDAEGNPVKLSDVVGNPANRYVLLDIWATWCSPCRESIPELREAYAKYHEKGMEIYSLSEDYREKNWKPFIEENGMTWINVRDTEPGREHSKTWYNYALTGIPTVILIDGDTGEIIARGNRLDLDALLSGLLP